MDFQLVAAMLGRGAAAAGARVEEACGDQGGRQAGAHISASREKLSSKGAGP